jgi:protein-ribulosamine 3-kinase
MNGLWEAIGQAIREAGATSPRGGVRPIGGGCINESFAVGDGAAHYFVKLNSAERLPMFVAEAAGLRALAAANAPRVPRPIAYGNACGRSYLVLEHIEFGTADRAGYARLGEALAELHGLHGPRFGWPHDNWLGTTAQANGQQADWPAFFAEQRLRPQLELAAKQGFDSVRDPGTRLCARLPILLAGHRPAPSLLHGDLWHGNCGIDSHGRPVLYDPACYYGDRETDLAMSELFGGFPGAFYDAYRANAPLPEGYPARRGLYQLYHLLNHLNLFGSSYLPQVQRVMRGLLAD